MALFDETQALVFDDTQALVFDETQALLFDVFGTVVDWRSTVTATLEKAAKASLSMHGSSVPPPVRTRAASLEHGDWARFAEEWRAAYHDYTRTTAADPDARPKTVDEFHYEALVKQLRAWDLGGLWTDDRVQELSLTWHKLNPWPDSAAGIEALNTKYLTCTLSNGNMSLLEDLVRHGELPFTHVMSTELFGTFKPNPNAYLGAAARLGLEPARCCMVAAHLYDLKAARCCGFRTIYVERPQEELLRPEDIAQAKDEGYVDLWVTESESGLLEVADQLSQRSCPVRAQAMRARFQAVPAGS